MPEPLPIPAHFNGETHMLARTVDGRIYHAPIPAVRFASDLVANGASEDLAPAEQVLSGPAPVRGLRRINRTFGIFGWQGIWPGRGR